MNLRSSKRQQKGLPPWTAPPIKPPQAEDALSFPTVTYQQLLAVYPELLERSGAGVEISGVSGGGKSVTAETLFFDWVRMGRQAFYFCPHGTSAKKLYRMCLDLPRHRRKNILYVRPASGQIHLSMNPVGVSREGLSDWEWEAALNSKVGHTATIVGASVGESGWAGPLQRKWTRCWLWVIAKSLLYLSAIEECMNFDSPLYNRLSQFAPSLVAQTEMQELTSMRPAQREEFIGSSRVRVSAMLENVIVRMILSCTDSQMMEVLLGGFSIIFDLGTKGPKGTMLSYDDQGLLLNLYFSELMHAAMNIPEGAALRGPVPIFIDELPLFIRGGTSALLERCPQEVRKFSLRICPIRQGNSGLPDGKDNAFAKAVTQQCGVHIYHRHVGEDAVEFAKVLTPEVYDPHIVKYKHHVPQQFTEGHEILELTDRSTSQTTGATAGGSASKTASRTNSQSNTQTTTQTSSEARQIGNDARREAESRASSSAANQGSSHGTSTEQGTNWSSSKSESVSTTTKQVTLPVTVTRDVVTSVSFYSTDEFNLLVARVLARQDPGHAILHVAGKGVFQIKFPLLHDHLSRTPRSFANADAAHQAYLASLPFYWTSDEIELQREEALLRLMSVPQSREILSGPTSRPLLALEQDNETRAIKNIVAELIEKPENVYEF